LAIEARLFIKGGGMQTVIVIPTYNERDNIERLVEGILALRPDVQVLIVDDGSPDGTGEIAEALKERYSHVHAIHRPCKQGLGTAYIAGFKWALASGIDYVVTMDADFSHHPRYIPQVLAEAQTHDLVIGSRYIAGGGTLDCSPGRQLLSRTANAFARGALGLKVNDCTGGFRCYRRRALESIGLDQIFSDGYSFLIEILYRCQREGCRITKVPIIFEDRRRGASKISRKEILKAMYTVLRLWWGRVLPRR